MFPWNALLNKTEQGMTLAETLVTVVIAGILAALGFASLSGWSERKQVDGALVQLEQTLQQAKNQAIRQGRSCIVTLDEDTGVTPHVYTITSSNDCFGISDFVLPEKVMFVANVDADGDAFPDTTPEIEFSYQGYSSYSGTIVLSTTYQSKNQTCIVVPQDVGLIRSGYYQDSTWPLTASSIDANKCITP